MRSIRLVVVGDGAVGKWVPEIRRYCPNTPFLLIGNKLDLRGDPDVLERLAAKGQVPVSKDEIQQMTEEVGAVGHIENSAMLLMGVKDVFAAAFKTVLNPTKVPTPMPQMPNKPQEPLVAPKELLLSRSLGAMVGKKEFSDCTFVLRDKSEVLAHKVILSSSMPILRESLLLSMGGKLPSGFKLRHVETTTAATDLSRESTDECLKEERTVIEVDLEPAVFHCILNSIYTGLPPISDDFSVDIVKAATDFFNKFPRFTPEERRKIMVDLALNPNPPLSDVCFELEDKKRVFAHKVLLAATNDYFSAIFSSGMKESQLDVIPLTDVDQNGLTVLKEFLYSGRAESLNAENVVNTISLANKYNAKELVSHCEVVCKENITLFDEWELYQLATAHNCNQLTAYLEWEMRVKYEEIKDRSWFKNELPEEVRREIVAGQWPGEEYKRAVEAWKKKNKGGKRINLSNFLS